MITRGIVTREGLNGVVSRGIIALRGGGFSPAALFAGGEQGDAWIPEREFCYTLSAGGVFERVTTTGDAVARNTGMVNGINADQLTAAARPTYTEGGGLSWLAFDGVDDAMATAAIDFTGTDKMSVFAGVRLLTPRSNNAAIWQIGDAVTSATDALVRVISGDGSTDAVRAQLIGTAANQTTRITTDYPSTGIYTAIFDGAATGAAEIVLRRNGSVIDGGSATNSGVTSIGSQVLTIGQQGVASVFTNYNFYGLIAPGKVVSAAEITSTEAYMAGKTRVVL